MTTSVPTTCPLCGSDMSEEEGLLWCDECGINDQSETFLFYKEREKIHEREWNQGE